MQAATPGHCKYFHSGVKAFNKGTTNKCRSQNQKLRVLYFSQKKMEVPLLPYFLSFRTQEFRAGNSFSASIHSAQCTVSKHKSFLKRQNICFP